MSTHEPGRDREGRPENDPPLHFERRERPRPRAKSPEVRDHRYDSRGAMVKVGWMILLLMFVIYAMTLSGRPESWHWLIPPTESGNLDGNQASAATGESETALVELKSSASEHHPEGDRSPKTEDETPLVDADVTAVRDSDDLERDFVKGFIRSLDRTRTLALWQALSHAAKGKELPSGETSTVSGVVEALSREWSQWNERLDRHIADRPFSEDKLQRISATRQKWETLILPALAAIVVRPDPDADTRTLAEFRAMVGEVAESLVEHFAPVSRPVESYAWYSAWDRVFGYPVGVSRDELPSPRLNQLLSQPEIWAGKRIFLAGTVLRVQKVVAGPNPQRIEAYTLLWVKPDHATNAPYCVYTLEPPKELVAPASGKIAETQVPVTIAGLFFKVRLFDAGGRSAEAPVILVPTVEVASRQQATGQPTGGSEAGGVSLSVMLGLVGTASLIAWVAWRNSSGAKHRGVIKGKRLNEAMSALKKNPSVETVSESLRRLENQAGSDDAGD